MFRQVKIYLPLLTVAILFSIKGYTKELFIYHDADYSVNSVSANAMKMGFLTALDELGNDFSGYQLTFVEKNHRGNIKRSYKTMQQFLKSDNALFVLGGLHSPPYIKHRKFINENNILLLVPWAAGGPITRYPSADNWVYRLSIDDTKAGIRLSQHADQVLGCESPHMLLENTPWGKSNFNTITSYYEGIKSVSVTWFDWNTKENVAKIKLREALGKNNDCIFLVANYAETQAIFNAMKTFPDNQQVPIISHWGFTGGDINKLMTPEVTERLKLSFIQSCYSFGSDKPQQGLDVLKRAQKLFPEADLAPENIQAPAGFIHGYDLGKVALTALKSVKLTGNIASDRSKLKQALESKELTAAGLIKQYNHPFSKWTEQQQDAHEALGLTDFCMASFGEKNQIKVHKNTF